MQTFFTTNSPKLWGELCDVVRLFVEARSIEDRCSGCGVFIRHIFGSDFHVCELFIDGEKKSSHVLMSANSTDKQAKRSAKIAIYRCLRDYYGDVPWGSLTGVRPTRLFRETAKLYGVDSTESIFLNEFDVSPEKTALVKKICQNQADLIAPPEVLDVYISIPFCVSRCAYCSFSSTLADEKIMDKYVGALLRELSLLDELHGKRRCVYIGGGTPTALPLRELERVVNYAAQLGAVEFTVEAGRPDTITQEKLQLLKGANVSRISVNTQTTSTETLERIGRAHTADDFFRAFEMAQKVGFDEINTDLIVGLPGEDMDIFMRSLNETIALSPTNITIHTLAIKRASSFGISNERRFVSDAQAQAILSSAHETLEAAGYVPYYMYRQKYMTGNLENVGYTIPGHACLYNVDIMEETANVAAFGAGAISKFLFPGENRLERAPNVKDITHYLTRTMEMAERKRLLFLGR